MSLEKKLIRLAYENKELRPSLLPLLKEASFLDSYKFPLNRLKRLNKIWNLERSFLDEQNSFKPLLQGLKVFSFNHISALLLHDRLEQKVFLQGARKLGSFEIKGDTFPGSLYFKVMLFSKDGVPVALLRQMRSGETAVAFPSADVVRLGVFNFSKSASKVTWDEILDSMKNPKELTKEEKALLHYKNEAERLKTPFTIAVKGPQKLRVRWTSSYKKDGGKEYQLPLFPNARPEKDEPVFLYFLEDPKGWITEVGYYTKNLKKHSLKDFKEMTSDKPRKWILDWAAQYFKQYLSDLKRKTDFSKVDKWRDEYEKALFG